MTSFIRKASIIKEKTEITDEDIEKLTNEYNSIQENAPIIPDRVFLREKQRLRIKMEISKQLEITPHMSISFYKLKMRLMQINVQKSGVENNCKDHPADL